VSDYSRCYSDGLHNWRAYIDRRYVIKLLGVLRLGGVTVGVDIPVVRYVVSSLPGEYSYPITRLVRVMTGLRYSQDKRFST